MSLPALWKIESEVALRAAEVQQMLDNGEEPSDEQLASLAHVVAMGKAKADALGFFVLGLMADAESCENLARRQKERADRMLRTRKRLDAYVLSVLEEHGHEKVVGVHFTLRAQRSPLHVEVTDEQAIPEDLMRRPPPYPDKGAIQQRINAGQDVPGARLVRGKHLRIDQ